MEEIHITRIERQNILNNNIALKNIQKEFDLNGFIYNDTFFYTNSQLASFFKVDIRTIERIVESHRDELEENGYTTLKGTKLADFKKNYINYGTDIDVGTIGKTSILSVSTFRTLLNFAMLLTNSDVAKLVRTRLIDNTLNILTEKTGGNTKYINQRDKDYLSTLFKEENARKKFTDSIDKYVDGNHYKYGQLTNVLYIVVFKEKASEYRKILKLKNSENVRETMYAEILLIISSFENGLAVELKQKSDELGRKLTYIEAKEIIEGLETNPYFEPMLKDARIKMASRDLGFRDALHLSLQDYISPITENDYEKFLGEQSKSLEDQIKEHQEIFLRLRDK
ncbi:DNA-binding protein [Globicatella sulfidifaciens]